MCGAGEGCCNVSLFKIFFSDPACMNRSNNKSPCPPIPNHLPPTTKLPPISPPPKCDAAKVVKAIILDVDRFYKPRVRCRRRFGSGGVIKEVVCQPTPFDGSFLHKNRIRSPKVVCMNFIYHERLEVYLQNCPVLSPNPDLGGSEDAKFSLCSRNCALVAEEYWVSLSLNTDYLCMALIFFVPVARFSYNGITACNLALQNMMLG